MVRNRSGKAKDPHAVRAVPHIEEMLALALADNIGSSMSLGMFAHYMRTGSHPAGSMARADVLHHLRTALTEGLMVAGTVGYTEHRPWGLGPEAALHSIAASWPQHIPAEYTNLRDICWLANTSRGDDVGRAFARAAAH